MRVFAAAPRGRTCGFRLLPWDGAVLGSGVIAWWMLRRNGAPLADVALLVLVHFFLFCNVFRVRRAYELVWAAILAANVYSAVRGGWLSTSWILTAQLPVSAVLLFLEVYSPEYHGVFCRRLNPAGVERWLQHEEKEEEKEGR